MANEQQKPTNAYRPKQVLIIGLGGVGSRITDMIMDKVPAEYRPYTRAVSIDTDKGDISALKNIPLENRIAIGEDITVGGFMKDNKDTADWMVKGDQLDLIRSRNTANGAKQIRLVSRIALRATTQKGDLGRRIESAINSLNAVDGKIQGNGLLVLVVCSIAGGTGAGTVIQVPMYLEEAIKSAYSTEKVQFECAMLMPNAFATTLSTENYKSGCVNGYAVMREIMSLNTGRLKRFEYFDPEEVDKDDERIAPYGRIMLFDDRNGEGEAIEGNVEVVHGPLMADALAEYLFGPANGKITSALDNTLKKLYDTNGNGLFGAVGKANLVFPRVLYKQYAVSKWVSKSMSDTWLDPDKKTKEMFLKALKDAKAQGLRELPEHYKYGLYLINVMEKSDNFFNEIKYQLGYNPAGIPGVDENEIHSLGDFYWFNVLNYMKSKCFSGNRDEYKNDMIMDESISFKEIGDIDTQKESLKKYQDNIVSLKNNIIAIADDIMKPSEAEDPNFYQDENKNRDNPARINAFMRECNLHPIALRCFLYQLYTRLLKESENTVEIADLTKKTDDELLGLFKNKKTRNKNLSNLIKATEESALAKYTAILAAEMLPAVKELINEVEDFFGSVKKVQNYFEETAENCLEEVESRDTRADMTIVGSRFSMHNCWKVLESKVHFGNEDEADVVDKDLCATLNKEIYYGYYRHVSSNSLAKIKVGNETFRLPTDYTKRLKDSLQKHFMNKVTNTYGAIFPENIVEAVKYDCGVKTAWNVAKKTVSHITLEDFVNEDPTNEENYETAKGLGLDIFDPAKVLNNKLSFAIGKAEPRCGLIVRPETDYTKRYIVMNMDILKEQKDFDASEQDTSVGEKRDLSKIIDGVPTNAINGVNVTPCFNGASKDVITCITSYAGLEPSNFVAFLAPTDDKNSPQDAMGYYKKYRSYINEVVSDPTKITPHLDRRWHIADILADVTSDHTFSVWKHSARAFVYGFVYDVIKVKNDGTVDFGEAGNPIFKAIEKSGIISVDYFISADERATLGKETGLEKRRKLNAVLNEIFVHLTSNPELSDAIVRYAEEKLADDYTYAKNEFLKNAEDNENIANEDYRCILDVIDGYYNGACKAGHKQKDYAIDTAQYMVEVLFTTVFEYISNFTKSPAAIKTAYEGIVDRYYLKAICDEGDDDENTENANDTQVQDASTPEEEKILSIEELMNEITASKENVAVQKPFSGKNNRFSKSAVKNLINQLLKDSE